MAKALVNIENEDSLDLIKTIGKFNKVDVNNKDLQINFAIKIAFDCIKNLDEESLLQVTGLKKSI